MKTKSIWIPMALAAAILLLVLGGILAWIHVDAANRWAAFKVEHRARLDRLASETGQRIPLLGDPTSGNAWEHYEPAINALGQAMQDGKIPHGVPGQALMRPEDPAARDQVRAFLPRAAPWLDQLRRGARMERARYPLKWELGARMQLPPLIRSQAAVGFLLVASRERREAGDRSGALDDLGAGFQVASDMASIPIPLCLLVACGLVKESCTLAKQYLEDPATTPEERARIVGFLKEVEARWPRFGDVVEANGVSLAQTFVVSEEGGASLGDLLHVDSRYDPQGRPVSLGMLAARRGFSFRRLFLEILDDERRLLEAVRAAEGLDVVEGERRARDIEHPWREDSSKVLSRMLLEGMAGANGSHREVLARLRLLRASQLVREGRRPGDPSWPVDPFSFKPLGFRETGGVVRIWSVAKDGVDSPSGSWSATLAGGEDFALEIRR